MAGATQNRSALCDEVRADQRACDLVECARCHTCADVRFCNVAKCAPSGCKASTLVLVQAPKRHNGPPSRNTESSQKGSRLAGVAPKYQLLNLVPKCGREMAGQGRPEERSVHPPRGGCDRLTETPVQRNGRAKPPRGGKVPVCSVATWSAWTRRVHRIHGVCWVITLKSSPRPGLMESSQKGSRLAGVAPKYQLLHQHTQAGRKSLPEPRHLGTE